MTRNATELPRARFVQFTFAIVVFAAQPACFIPVPPIPLNAPGYGHRYRIVDENNQPVETGLIFLESKFKIMNARTRVNCYDIRHGIAEVPVKILWDHWSTGMGFVPPIYPFGWQNPDLTRVRVLSPGKEIADFSTDGLSAHPTSIVLRSIDETAERHALHDILWLECDSWPCSKEDQIARTMLQDYLLERIPELLPDGGTSLAEEQIIFVDYPVEPEDQETTLRHSRTAP